MDKSIIVIINSNLARFFTLEPAEWPEYESGPNLIEQKNVSYSKANYEGNFWFNLISHPQRNSSNFVERSERFERKFGQQITSEIVSLIRIHQGQKLILVARPQILNLVKKFFKPTIFKTIQVTELNKDLSHFNTSKIHQYLAQKQLIPACQKIVYPR
jgi:protein required for attachment to host cells